MAQDGDIRVVVCPAGPGNPRNSEAAIAVLKDGTLLLAYSRMQGGADDAAGDIAGKTSSDGGRTWSDPFVVQRNDGRQNVMSACLLRLQSGKIGLAYARKNSDADCALLWRTSSDEGKTWSGEVLVSPPWGYGATGPDVVIQLKSGRLIAPDYRTTDWTVDPRMRGYVCRSDDEGQTWSHAEPITAPEGRSLEEPCVVELKDGRLLMYIRTKSGPIYQCFSSDQGVTWSVPEPSPLVHPTSPMQLRRIPSTGDLLCIWNNSTTHRYPLTAAVSRDEGVTWEHFRDLEVETAGVSQYAYASVAFHGGRALMTYWMINQAGINLVFRSLPEAWFYGG
jgi:Neuraminidase (sialidase)